MALSAAATSRSTDLRPPGRRPRHVDVSVVLPCLNEAETVAAVVEEAFDGIRAAGLVGEVIVVDNGSTDGSDAIAASRGARIVREDRRGYGSAYLAGLAQARGDYVVLADADGTYPLADLERLLEPLRGGADLVLGSRLNGDMEPGAMPWMNRWIGNPILTGLLNLFFRTGVSDAHSGLRALRRRSLRTLDLRTPGMEFASEMILKATRGGLRIEEVPIGKRARGGVSKLSPVRDAWRHVRFMLAHTPDWLFLFPGFALLFAGLVAELALARGPVDALGRTWQLHAMIFAAIATLVGAQIVQLGVFAKTIGVLFLGVGDPLLERWWRRFNLERGLAVGGTVLVAGVALVGYIAVRWLANGLGTLHEEYASVFGLTLVGLGVQVVFGSFFLSIIGLARGSR